MSFETGISLISFMSTSPVFKGIALMLLSVLAVLFGFWFNKGSEPSNNFKMYLAVAGIIFLYGLFILIVRPHWWLPPYIK